MSITFPQFRHRDEAAQAPIAVAPEKIVVWNPKLLPVEVPEPENWDKVRIMPMDRGLGRIAQIAVEQYGAEEFHDRLGIPMDEAQVKAHKLGIRLLKLGERAGEALDTTNLDDIYHAEHGPEKPTEAAFNHDGIASDEAAVTVRTLTKLAGEAAVSGEGLMALAMTHNIGDKLLAEGEVVTVQLDARPIAA